jgi:hypothetical protein
MSQTSQRKLAHSEFQCVGEALVLFLTSQGYDVRGTCNVVRDGSQLLYIANPLHYFFYFNDGIDRHA